jgi:hypothetical protein
LRCLHVNFIHNTNDIMEHMKKMIQLDSYSTPKTIEQMCQEVTAS